MAKRFQEKKGNTPATAAGQALGYSLQQTRLAVILHEAPAGSACSLEVLDDIAEQTAGGDTRLVQSKSALTDNPVADRAISLWKTIYNWLQLVNQGLIDPNTTIFEIYVSRLVSGAIVDSFNNAFTYTAGMLALAAARDELWGPAPDRSERANLSKGLQKYANPVLEADESLLIPIIRNFRLTCGSGSPQADFEKLIADDPVSPSKVSFVADKMIGWVKRQADMKMEKELPAVIMRDDFHREYTAYLRSVDRESILKSFSPKPTHSQKLDRMPDLFVQQLDIIGIDFDEKLEAISDLLRASSDRSIWSKIGDVHEDSFGELNESLSRAWRNLKHGTEIEYAGRPAVDCGKLLYLECMKHRAKVQQMEPPDHFIPGCFHLLADELEVGWHPQYKTLLQDKVKEAV